VTDIGFKVYDKPDGSILKDKESLREGMEIFVPMGQSWAVFTVDASHDGDFYGISKDAATGCILEHDRDDRACWVASGFFNLRGLRKLEITK
jgi:hypothetical protein